MAKETARARHAGIAAGIGNAGFRSNGIVSVDRNVQSNSTQPFLKCLLILAMMRCFAAYRYMHYNLF